MRTKKGHLYASYLTDMTFGNPMGVIFSFALPLLIGNIFQQIYTMVDTIAVGHILGDEAISAIGATSAIYSLIITFATGLNSGFSIVAARNFSEIFDRKIQRTVFGIFVINAVSTVLLTGLPIVSIVPLMRFLNTPDSVFDDAYAYILVLCIGLFSTIGYNMFAGILRAFGDSKTPLYALIVACVVNVALDFPLIMLMGVTGAALATVIAQTVSAIFCAITFFKLCYFFVPEKNDMHVERELLFEIVTSGISMALMMCVVSIGSVIFQRANNLLGEDIIAAHSSSHKIFTVILQPVAAMSTALSTFVSQNHGSGRYDRVRSALWRVILVVAGWGILSCIIVYLVGDPVIRLLTATENEVIVSNAVMSMRICLPFFPILGALQCLRTAMQAMGCKTAPVLSSCVEVLMKIVGAAFLIPAYGYFGACITEPLTWVAMLAFLAVSYLILYKKIYVKRPITIGFDIVD